MQTLGTLPTSLIVNHKKYAIRSDYRNILQIINAFNDDSLRDAEKVYICLKRLYVDFSLLPEPDLAAAYEAAMSFIECGSKSDKPGPRVINWAKDEQMIFAAINKVAGREVRAESYMHWWTFLGYFQSIDREDLWGFVLTIRQKKAKHKKLEKYETEFYNANRSTCELESPQQKKQDALDYMDSLYKELSMEGG